MRRQTVPAPDPRVTALAWASLSYVTACAVLMAPMPPLPMPNELVSAVGMPAAKAFGGALVAGLVPAVIVAWLAGRTTAEWPAARFTATYLAMLVVMAALQLIGGAADITSYGVADCCLAPPR